MVNRVYRVRKCYAFKNSANFVSHADIITPCPALAICSALQGKVSNWRRIDSYDQSEVSYKAFYFWGELDPNTNLIVSPKEVNL